MAPASDKSATSPPSKTSDRKQTEVDEERVETRVTETSEPLIWRKQGKAAQVVDKGKVREPEFSISLYPWVLTALYRNLQMIPTVVGR